MSNPKCHRNHLHIHCNDCSDKGLKVIYIYKYSYIYIYIYTNI